MPVVNTSDGKPTGTQNLGTIVVSFGGAASGMQEYEDGRVTYDIATASGNVVSRFNHERYYSGDTEN